MSLRQGRIGTYEAVAMTAMALFFYGVFAIDPAFAYTAGNSVYAAIPLSIGLSLGIFLLYYAAMKKSRSRDLYDLLTYSVGRAGAGIVSAMLIAMLLICAYIPTSRLITLLNAFVFVTRHYEYMCVYLIPVVGVIVFLGFETISRMSLFYAPLIFLATLAAAAAAFPSYQTYRLYPLFGDGVFHMLEFAVSDTVMFIPPLFGILVAGRTIQGLGKAKRAAIYSGVIAIGICAVTLFALALVFDYKELTPIRIPLYRINMRLPQSHVFVRLDKLGIFIWLAGAILSSIYTLYIAAILYARTFSQGDVRPAAAALGALLLSVIQAGQGKLHQSFYDAINFLHRYGYYVVLPVLLLVAGIGLIKRGRPEGNEKN